MKHDLDLESTGRRKTIRKGFFEVFPATQRVTEQFTTLVNHLVTDTKNLFRKEEIKHIHPHIDVLENKNLYDIRVDLPGVDANSIDLKADGRMLTLKAKRIPAEPSELKMAYCEHRAETYEREIRLAADALIEEKSATFSDGILSIRIPRKAA
jgi:HSP20 family protein